MARAWLNLRHPDSERARAFHTGLARLGYAVASGVTTRPGPRDCLVSWNCIRDAAPAAEAFRARGLPVLITENASWGNGFQGGSWLTLARDSHNLAGKFPVGGPERWDALGVELAPWRTSGETVILPQRGIGLPGVAMPYGWAERARAQHGGRIRHHPGRHPVAVTLEADLARAGRVVTWGSGAAVLALLWGIPVTSELPGWIGACEPTDEGRLAMFRSLAHAQFTLEEIATGEPFDRLINFQV